MSGIDERPKIDLATLEKFNKMCLHCGASTRIVFKNAAGCLSGKLIWSRRINEIYVRLIDWRTTYNSIAKHTASCGCGAVMSKRSREYKAVLEIFRSKVLRPSWRIAHERARRETS